MNLAPKPPNSVPISAGGHEAGAGDGLPQTYLHSRAGSLKTRIQLLFLPPSVNSIYRVTRKGFFKTQEYLTWLNSEGWGLNRQMAGQRRWNEPVYVTIAYKRTDKHRDLDNLLKATIDLLKHHGVFTDDVLVHGINCWWTDDLPNGVAVEISITAAA